MGSCSSISRISGILTTYVAGTLFSLYYVVPFFLYGGFSFVAALLMFKLRETKGMRLQDFTEEVDENEVDDEDATKEQEAEEAPVEVDIPEMDADATTLTLYKEPEDGDD